LRYSVGDTPPQSPSCASTSRPSRGRSRHPQCGVDRAASGRRQRGNSNAAHRSGASPRVRPLAPAEARNTGSRGRAAAVPPAGSAATYGYGRSSLCAQQAGFAERTGQKVILKREFSDLRVQGFQIHRCRNIDRGSPAEKRRGTLRQLRLPGRDLVRVNVIHLGQFSQSLLALQSSQCHFSLERRRVVTAGTLRHHLSCSTASSPSSGRNSTYPSVRIWPATSIRCSPARMKVRKTGQPSLHSSKPAS
jgi:hypothetical protein